jgi:type II secretory pathway pseudopilin PulG
MDGSTVDMRNDTGFTIAELMVAAAILLFTATACISGILFAAQAVQLTERRTEALNLANQQIELARNLAFDDVATVEPSNGLPAGKIPGVQTIGIFTVNIDVAYGTYGASSAARYKTISAVVSWSAAPAGSITVSSMIAGASGTQDYNFGAVTLSVQDEATPPQGVAGVIVWLTDANSHAYSVVTTASGIAQFNYVPSGNITFAPIKAGYSFDALSSPVCVANTTTNYGPITAHALKTGFVRCLSPAGSPVSGVTVGLSGGPNTVPSVQSAADGYATFPNELIQGSYAIGITHAFYQLAGSAMLTVGATEGRATITLAVKPASVTATRSTKGKIYVWNTDGTLDASASSANSAPFSAVFSLTNSDIQPTTYYFTQTNAFAATNPLAVTPGLTYTVTVK